MRILVDMDGVVADLHAKWLAAYNREWSDDLHVGRLLTYRVHEHVRPDCGRQVYDIIKRAGFFDDLDPVPGAVEGVRALLELGHEVLVCTASTGADSARAKLDWCQRHLGFRDRDVVLTNRKELVDADIIIEDAPENADAFLARGINRRAWLIRYPYNEHCRAWGGATMFDGWDRPAEAWTEIVRHATPLGVRR